MTSLSGYTIVVIAPPHLATPKIRTYFYAFEHCKVNISVLAQRTQALQLTEEPGYEAISAFTSCICVIVKIMCLQACDCLSFVTKLRALHFQCIYFSSFGL